MPPGYQLMLHHSLRDQLHDDDGDLLRWRSAPLLARATCYDYAIKVQAGEIREPGPCCWLDPTTRKCRWYEHRPEICRDFELGGESCLRKRERWGELAAKPRP